MSYRVFKRTNDDWYGAFILDGECKLVELVFSPTLWESVNGEWIVYATGNDDYAIKKIFDSESKAWLAFTTILGWDFVDQQELLNIGFIYD